MFVVPVCQPKQTVHLCGQEPADGQHGWNTDV